MSDSPARSFAWYSAAAAGALALSSSDAEAQIVLTDINPDAVLSADVGDDNAFITIDFDRDGDPELVILEFAEAIDNTGTPTGDPIDYIVLGSEAATGQDSLLALVSTPVMVEDNVYQYLRPLSAGAEISDDTVSPLNLDVGPTFTFAGYDGAGWRSAGDAYVGVKFELEEGTTHFGWINVEIDEPGRIIVKSYAYDSDPNRAISVDSEEAPAAAALALSPVVPNPIRDRATFEIRIPETGEVRATLHDLLGREVRSVFDGELVGGVAHPMELRTSGLPAGTYVLRITSDDLDTVQRVTVAR